MFTNKTIAVIKRELKEKLFSKTFIFMTLLIPLLMFGILGIQTLLMSYEGDKSVKLLLVTESAKLTETLQKEFSQQEYVKSKQYSIEYTTAAKNDFKNILNKDKKSLIDESVNAIVYISDSSQNSKKVEYYSKNPNNNTVFNKLKNPINKSLIALYFEGKNISEKDINYAKEGVDFNAFRVSKDQKVEEEGYGNRIVSFLFTFLLYMSMIFAGTQLMQSVIEEKTNRIVETLLSSLNPGELMTGKILGGAITGFFQMAIWISPLIVVVSSSIFALPTEFIMKISMWQIAYFLFNYVIGSITFLGLFGAVGSMFDNPQDAQSGVWPIMMLIMIPFFISLGMQSGSDNQISQIASMFPFASIIVMPARMAFIEVSFWQVAVSIVVNLATMLGVFALSGKIYRIGILLTGKKPKWSEIIGWLRLNN